VGIGGIGVSALAQYYLAKGHKISGSDLAASEITEDLKKKGANITIGKNTINRKADLVIYSPAVPLPNVKRQLSDVKTLSYPEALGELTKKYFTIAISGTHGKSTTTAMLGLLLVKAGLDPTVIVGTKVREFGNTNCRIGKSKYLIIEACEHFASFLHYWPKIIVVTGLEPDHLDYYKNIGNLKKAFREFIGHLPQDGLLLDMRRFSHKAADTDKLKKILKVPGDHNVANALASLAVARALRVPDKISFKALSEYKGSWRRFEIVSQKPLIVSDYGHHPTEVKLTLKAAREKWPAKEIWCVYQPHQYQRTYYLFDDFVTVFKKAPIDRIIITDVFDVAGREEKKIKQRIDSKKIVEKVNKENVIYLPQKKIINYLKSNPSSGRVLIFMGAGDIYRLVDRISC